MIHVKLVDLNEFSRECHEVIGILQLFFNFFLKTQFFKLKIQKKRERGERRSSEIVIPFIKSLIIQSRRLVDLSLNSKD